MNYSEKQLHNTEPKGFKNYVQVSSVNNSIIIKRKRYEYCINGIVFKLPKNFHPVQFLKSLHQISNIKLDDVEESKNKELLKTLVKPAKEIYEDLNFNYSSFIGFVNYINVIPLS